jgi:ABC-type Na+ transport system ATPase subunit NatA
VSKMDIAIGAAVGAIIALYILAPTIQAQKDEIAELEADVDALLDDLDLQEEMDQRFMEASQRYKRTTT